MANALVIFDGNGALPQKATFDSNTDGNVTFVITCTAWTTTSGGTLLGVDLYLDGNAIGGSPGYANQSSVHQALRPTFIPYSGMTIGEHTIELAASNPVTVTDVNDYYQVVMLY